MTTTKLTLGALALGLLGGVASAQVKVDPKLPRYTPTTGVDGNIASVGSDTMNNLMALWAEGFKRTYPSVQVEIEGKGSSTAPPALIAGKSTFGPMSRLMKAQEVDDFKKAFGYEPTAMATGIDMLGIYVHKDNPIAGMTMQQVDAIFSKTRTGGYKSDIRTWGDLGLTGDWKNKPISLYGRNSASGTYGYFKKFALFKGDFKDSVKEQPGSSAVVQGIASDKYGIGYSGLGYKTADVRIVPLAVDDDEFIPAEPQYAYSGEYPLSRFLWVYVNKEPNKPLEPLRAEFLKYAYSREGQMDVIKDGYLPITANIAKQYLGKVGIKLPEVKEASSPRK